MTRGRLSPVCSGPPRVSLAVRRYEDITPRKTTTCAQPVVLGRPISTFPVRPADANRKINNPARVFVRSTGERRENKK